MEMKNYSTRKSLLSFGMRIVGVLMAVILFSSCNEQFDRVLQDDYGDAGTDYQKGKVLFIMVDGAAGKAVQQAVNMAQAPHIKKILDNSMYTFEGLADSRVNLPHISNDRGWANLLTGTTTHGIGNTSQSISEMEAPSFLSLLKSADQNLKVSLFSSNENIVSALAVDVDQEHALANDQAVTDAVVSQFGNTSTAVSDVMLAQLEGVNKSGLENGFYTETGAPTNALITAIQIMDAQIGQMVDALKARPGFSKENWLVVVTSNYGGVYTGEKEGTFYEDPERNTFTILHSPRLSSSLFQPPAADELKYSFFTPYFSGQGQASKSASVRDASLFDIGARKDDKNSYTVQFHLWDNYYDFANQSASGSQTIVSKRDKHNSGAGWQIRFNGSNITNAANSGSVSSSGNLFRQRNNPWRTVTYVFKEIKDSNYGDTLFVFIDGVQQGKGGHMYAQAAMSTEKPLTIGWIEGGDVGARTRFVVTNLQFYNVALPPAYIAANACKTRLDEIEGFEYWDNLLGYWPNDREEDYGLNIIKDYSKYGSVYGGENAGRSDMVFKEPAFWTFGSSVEENLCPAPDPSYFRAVFNTVDIPFQIMTWLGVTVDKAWKLEGMGWPLKYRILTD